MYYGNLNQFMPLDDNSLNRLSTKQKVLSFGKLEIFSIYSLIKYSFILIVIFYRYHFIPVVTFYKCTFIIYKQGTSSLTKLLTPNSLQKLEKHFILLVVILSWGFSYFILGLRISFCVYRQID